MTTTGAVRDPRHRRVELDAEVAEIGYTALEFTEGCGHRAVDRALRQRRPLPGRVVPGVAVSPLLHRFHRTGSATPTSPTENTRSSRPFSPTSLMGCSPTGRGGSAPTPPGVPVRHDRTQPAPRDRRIGRRQPLPRPQRDSAPQDHPLSQAGWRARSANRSFTCPAIGPGRPDGFDCGAAQSTTSRLPPAGTDKIPPDTAQPRPTMEKLEHQLTQCSSRRS